MPRAIKLKLQRLGVVVLKQKMPRTTTTAVKSRELLTHEETLKLLAEALETLRESGLDNHPFSSAIELGICGGVMFIYSAGGGV